MLRILLAATLVAGGPGCSSLAPPPPPGPTPIQEALTELEQGARVEPATPPPAVRDALLPPLSQPDADQPDARADERFDVTVRDAPAQEFFMKLVEGTPDNMVVHPSVQGTISLRLGDVSVEDVMRTVRDVYGYQYRRTPHGYEVLPSRLHSRVYEVDYLNLQRTGFSQTRVNSGQVTEQAGGGSGEDALVIGGDQGSITGSRVDTSTAADVWAELTATLGLIVGEGEGRFVRAAPQTGTVVVRAMPGEHAEVQEFLDTIHRNLARQVVIEAKVLEVALDDEFRSGINWAAVFGQVTVGQTGGGTIFDNAAGLSDIAGNSGILNPDMLQPIDGTAASAFGGPFSIAVALDDFAAFIELLESQGRVETLSSPRVSTLNNQKAMIKVGSDEFFVTDISATTVVSTATTTTPDVTLTPFFSGIALDVTPQISEAGTVTLHVHPSISEVTDQTKTVDIGGDTDTLTLPLAFSTIREADSIVRAQSGQVIVIGGLMQNSVRDDRSGIPWLGRVPGLGAIFRQTRDRLSKTELVILLRPEVVDASGWTSVTDRAAARLRPFEGSDSTDPVVRGLDGRP
jgi:MSHA biogenesis protein MshL